MAWRANGSTAFAELTEMESPWSQSAAPSFGGTALEFEGPYAPGFGSEEEAGTALRMAAVTIARAESARWGNKSRKETDPAMAPALRLYWKTVVSDTDADRMIRNRDPWSAAFISWVMRSAGAGASFTYSAAHRVYVSAAKRARLAGTPDKFWAYRVTEVKPELGDLICRDREKSAGVCSGTTYDNVDDGTAWNTHSDVVVDIQPGKLVSIGGNVSDSVGETKVSLDANGMLVQPGGCLYYAILKWPGSTGTVDAPSTPSYGTTPAPAPAPTTSTPSWYDTVTSLPGKVLAAVREGLITFQVGEAIIGGNRDENSLSDMLFYGKHPELPPGYQIKKTDTQLAQDWLKGRETVRMLLRATG